MLEQELSRLNGNLEKLNDALGRIATVLERPVPAMTLESTVVDDDTHDERTLRAMDAKPEAAPKSDDAQEEDKPRRTRKKKAEPEPEVLEDDDPTVSNIPTEADLKDRCLALVRASMDNKAAIKSLLDKYGADKLKDLSEKDRVAVMKALEGMGKGNG